MSGPAQALASGGFFICVACICDVVPWQNGLGAMSELSPLFGPKRTCTTSLPPHDLFARKIITPSDTFLAK